jgi:hypothetical protein
MNLAHILHVHNLPLNAGGALSTVINNLTTIRTIVIAPDSIQVEFFSVADKDIVKTYLQGMTWRGKQLRVIEYLMTPVL